MRIDIPVVVSLIVIAAIALLALAASWVFPKQKHVRQ